MVKIYTKRGDQGKTIIGGREVAKNHPKISALGVLDELGSVLGVVLAWMPDLKILEEIQRDLMEIGASLAGKKEEVTGGFRKRTAILEKEIDKIWEDLPPLKNFLLPQGGKAGSFLHLSRAICRRAEREIVVLCQKEKIPAEIITYLNRLSDFLFALARWVNKREGYAEKIWP